MRRWGRALATVDPDALLVPADATYEGETCIIVTETPTRVLSEVMGAATSRGHELAGLSVRRPSLEDVFLGLATGWGVGRTLCRAHDEARAARGRIELQAPASGGAGVSFRWNLARPSRNSHEGP